MKKWYLSIAALICLPLGLLAFGLYGKHLVEERFAKLGLPGDASWEAIDFNWNVPPVNRDPSGSAISANRRGMAFRYRLKSFSDGTQDPNSFMVVRVLMIPYFARIE